RLEVRLFSRELRLFGPLLVKFFLEFLEALARLLRGVPELFQLPVRVVVFDLIRLPRFLELRDFRLEAGHRFLGAVSLQDDSFDVSIPSVARARPMRRPSSFSLSCFASSPPRSAICCSSSFRRATAASSSFRSSAFWASSFSLSASCFAICSFVPTI